MKTCLALAAAVAVVGSASSARAWGWWNLSAGAKGIVGANVWTQPTNVPFTEDLMFAKARAGYGGGAGIFVQARFVKYIAIEMDALFETGQLSEKQTIYVSGMTALEYRNTATTVNARIPIIVKGVLPLPGMQLSLGLGPEFVVPLKTTASTTTLSGFGKGPAFTARGKTSTMLTMELGITPVLPLGFVIPIGLRASYNATQPQRWANRVDATMVGNNVIAYNVKNQNSWDFRLAIGLGYEF